MARHCQRGQIARACNVFVEDRQSPAECRRGSATRTSYALQCEIRKESHAVTSLIPAIERGLRRVSGFRISAAWAANAPGVTDTEIKIGQTMPYSGPASSVMGMIGRADAAYFKMINEMGGVNGRRINLISLDDGYNPSKTVEQVRRLVEQEQVAFIFNSAGTSPNLAVQPYLNDNKVPQIFVPSGSSRFGDPRHFPWTIGCLPELSDRGAYLCQAYSRDEARRQDRRAVPERCGRQRVSDRSSGRPRR